MSLSDGQGQRVGRRPMAEGFDAVIAAGAVGVDGDGRRLGSPGPQPQDQGSQDHLVAEVSEPNQPATAIRMLMA